MIVQFLDFPGLKIAASFRLIDLIPGVIVVLSLAFILLLYRSSFLFVFGSYSGISNLSSTAITTGTLIFLLIYVGLSIHTSIVMLIGSSFYSLEVPFFIQNTILFLSIQ